MKETKYPITIFLPAKYIKYIDQKAEELGLSRSAFLRHLIITHLNKEMEEQKKANPSY